jgi:hypothetical protein
VQLAEWSGRVVVQCGGCGGLEEVDHDPGEAAF